MVEEGSSEIRALSPILTHEWFVFRYGVPTLVPESVEELVRNGGKYAWRNELHEIYHLTCRCPWAVLAEMTDQMVKHGVDVSGIVSDSGSDSYSAQWNLALQHQERLKLPARWRSQFQYDARELTQPDTIAKDAIPCHDQFSGFKVVPEKRTVYSWVNQREIALDFRIEVEENSSIQEGGVSDLTLSGSADSVTEWSGSPVRPLPFPYRHFLSINSDIDWTTHDQLQEFDSFTRESWGSPWGGSAYFSAESPDWISLENDEGNLDPGLRDSIDTLHTWADTIEKLDLTPGASNRWSVSGHGCFRSLVVWLSEPSSELKAELPGGNADFDGVHHSPVPAKNGKYAVVFSFGNATEFFSQEIRIQFEGLDEGAEIDSCFLCSLDPLSIRRWVRENAEKSDGGWKIPVFSFHGGGENVREIAALRTGLVKQREPDLLACDLDDPGSPFYLVPELKMLGVEFLNPRGAFITREPVRIEDLLQKEKLDDGSEFPVFRRFLTNRHESLGMPAKWRQEKSASHPEALEFILSDLLQRFARGKFGTGSIVYTHLGHKSGHQMSEGLEWPVHFRAWLDEVKRLSGEEGKVWFASASEILQFAKVRAELLKDGVCQVSGNRIEIQIDGGLKVLEGQALFLKNPEELEVFVGGAEVNSDSFRINERVEGEPASITFL